MSDASQQSELTVQPRKWRALSRAQRRVAGVLIEKSKTTPDVYPMTINAIVAGANQKSNRSPLMQMDADEVEMVLDELRRLGAVMEVQSDGRVPRFKHLLYDWFGVDRGELAILAELLLRGHQTLGELRARTARMEEIADLQQLRPLVDSLLHKNLMLELTPPGRGQVVSHNLYQPEELAKIKLMVSAEAVGDEPAEPAVASMSSTAAGAELEQRVSDLERIVAALSKRLDFLEG